MSSLPGGRLPSIKDLCPGVQFPRPVYGAPSTQGPTAAAVYPIGPLRQLQLPPLLVTSQRQAPAFSGAGRTEHPSWQEHQRSLSPPSSRSSARYSRARTPSSSTPSSVREIENTGSVSGSAPSSLGQFSPSQCHKNVEASVLGVADCHIAHSTSSKLGQPDWFDPNTERAQHMEQYISSLDRDSLYQTFCRGIRRPFYGQHRRPCKNDVPKLELDKSQFKTIKEYKHAQQKHNHSAVEKKRRDRHFDLQSFIHQITPDAVHAMTETDPELLEHRNAKSRASAKDPGKDEQLVSTLYFYYLSARVAQSEHEARVAAESQVRELKAKLEAQRSSRSCRRSHSSMEDDVLYSQDTCRPSKRRKGSLSPVKGDRIGASGQSSLSSLHTGFRVPPSPSLSSTLSFGSHSTDSTMAWSLINPQHEE